MLERKIERALISLSDKTGLLELAQYLDKNGVEILSTGGTAKLIRDAGIKVKDVSDHTSFPEIMDGRVKTLHPLIHGGLLACLDNEEHIKAMENNNIKKIDLVIVNLYPFAETVQKTDNFEEIIENIDIGGPSMVRSAAKNHKFTTIITDNKDFSALIEELEKNNFTTTKEFRLEMAKKAFALTAYYDSMISNWFYSLENQMPRQINLSAKIGQELRYGENPHQMAALYKLEDNVGIISAKQLQGKELSYNNINDADSAYTIVKEFKEPACVIIKHANPCGAATAENIFDAYIKALDSDPVSAFGGIIAVNREIDLKLAHKIIEIFTEVIIAPNVTAEAMEVFATKKNLRILTTEGLEISKNKFLVKSVEGGLLLQNTDDKTIKEDGLKFVTKVRPTKEQIRDMLFAFTICKHVKSNAIVIAKNASTTGVGPGQTSRIESVKIAFGKTTESKNSSLSGDLVLASDAFFPFADSIEMAHEIGIKAIIQPGGSVQDEAVIAKADELGIAMVFTGVRHFKH